jgi:hypothetical protein
MVPAYGIGARTWLDESASRSPQHAGTPEQRVEKKGDRSHLIDEAIRCYVSRISRNNLRTQLAEGYERRADRDLRIAEEWFTVEKGARP